MFSDWNKEVGKVALVKIPRQVGDFAPESSNAHHSYRRGSPDFPAARRPSCR